MKSFKPILAPNDQPDLNDIKYPILASYKLDGIRCIFKDGQMLSRSLKPIVNKQLREKFECIRLWTEKTGNILDGEIYCKEIPFSLISSCVMTQDYTDKKAIKKWTEKCEEYDVHISREEALTHLKFYCFDFLFGGRTTYSFDERIKAVGEISEEVDNIIPVKHVLLNNKEEVQEYFEEALKDGFEGLILRDPHGHYKFGRGTLKEGLIYKVKPFVTFDAKIIAVLQGTRVDANAEKKINELGRSVTSKKKDDRILVDMVKDFTVRYKNTTVDVSCSKMTHKQRKQAWVDREELIGKTIEYKGMLIGSKDKPRHPNFIRFREDKDN